MPDARGPSIRIGIGSDIHRLVAGRALTLGGVKIPFEWGLSGHSDADVLIHAIIDALLGAAAHGDIGRPFPSSDKRWAGISSLKLLEKTVAMLRAKGFEVINVDATVMAERPLLGQWIPAMGRNIAPIMEVEGERISIKATSAKGMGPVGEGEAISAISIALIRKVDSSVLQAE
ncbi:MAG: 2-C-methyl-D-erythritol 2,4-cyclodiphosphate synthase [Candidatus Glassbacteria bacterium RBG_16_58_8]|uniref:2-C-methyl-D-erythritol 2,4-cyclodiphosphate synthase n=1 Tax=Candidatus Glassbacteria bacterium RBG_16_58_8 TaxID=1817866 RepID=A0A1F5YC80_9BACT|nr:MAG: 2-C-methyl-D-erythritol 2,4-cyclodiphosphate synthase [Candidatus Glassbacteria bacterium RBG_16_58_8]